MTQVLLPELSKQTGIKISAEKLSFKVFSGIDAAKIDIEIPNNIKLTANKLNLDFVFKELFNKKFHFKNLLLKDLKYIDSNLGEITTDLRTSGEYSLTGRKLEAQVITFLSSLELKNHPELSLAIPTKINLNIIFDPNIDQTIKIKSVFSNLDILDSNFGKYQGSQKINGTYSFKKKRFSGEIENKTKHLSLINYPDLILESGTNLKTKIDFKDNKLKLEKLNIQIKPNQQEQLNIKGEGLINSVKNIYDFDLELESKTISLSQILASFKSKATDNKVSEQSQNADPNSKTKSKNSSDLKLNINYQITTDTFTYQDLELLNASATGKFNIPDEALTGNLSYKAQINSEQLKFKNLKLTDLTTDGFGTNQSLNINQFNFRQGEKLIGSANGNLNFFSQNFQIKLDLKDLKLDSVLPDLCGDACEKIKGDLTKVAINLAGSGFSKELFNKNVQGNISISGEDVFLPAKLQNIPPVNLIFLPYNIVSEISSLTIAKILPDSLLSVSSKANNALNEQGRIKIKDFKLGLEIDESAYRIKEADFRMNLVPSANFSGSILKNKDLNMEVGLWLMGLQIRIPVGGTLNLPLPKLYELPVTLVKGLGLSVWDLVPESNTETTEE